jgi:hypothetical protein
MEVPKIPNFAPLGDMKEDGCHNEYMQNSPLWYVLRECSKLGNHVIKVLMSE